MPYVSVPKDLSKVKTKVAFNLTKRQLICFSLGGAVGLPTYFLTRGVIGNTPALLTMIVLMAPFFFFALYEKDGQPAEKILKNRLRFMLWPRERPYITDNIYKSDKKGVLMIDKKQAAVNAKKKAAAKRQKVRKSTHRG